MLNSGTMKKQTISIISIEVLIDFINSVIAVHVFFYEQLHIFFQPRKLMIAQHIHTIPYSFP